MKKTVLLFIATVTLLTGCAQLGNFTNSLKGSITGNTYQIEFYSNDGEKFMEMSGQNIDMSGNPVREPVYTDSGWGYTKTMSSVVTVTIDGHQVENCGSTMIFAENGLKKDVDFMAPDSITSNGGSPVIVAEAVNSVKNSFGKPVVIVIQSQLGDPICAYSGEKVYWEVCEDLPKTTKLMIDGHALYIHRANFQIIDKDLL